jgi:hypothetical protein
MFLWNTWWAPHSLTVAGNSPLHTDHLFHPEGSALVVNTHCVLTALLSAPLQWCFGLVTAYNLMILLSFVLSALGVLLLTQEITRNPGAALVAGAMFAFAQYRVSTIMFFNLIQSHWLAWFAWALWRMLERRSRGAALLAALFAAALLYSSYNLFTLAGLFGVLFFCYGLVQSLRNRDGKGFLLRTSMLLTVLAVLAVPLIFSLQAEIDENDYYAAMAASKSYEESTALSNWLLRHPLAEGERFLIRQASYLGSVVMLMVLVGMVVAVRRASLWFWLLTALLFLLFALGPQLRWDADGEVLAQLPYRHLREVPVLGELRVAHRFGVVACLSLSVVASFGLAALLRGRWGKAWTAVLLAAVVFDFSQLPFPKQYRLPEIPPALQDIASDPRDCCVLEFPGGRSGYTPFSYYQTVHQKPVYLDGQLARTPDRLKTEQQQSSILRNFEAAFAGRGSAKEPAKSLTRALAREAHKNRIGWIVLAWADLDVLMKKRNEANLPGLDQLVQLIEGSFEIEETAFAAEAAGIDQWQEMRPIPRRSASCLYRIYKLRLP